MGTRIFPRSVLGSLTGINNTLSNQSDSAITSIRSSVSAFRGASELQGVAFNNLKSHMDGEISQGLLTRVEAAVDALIAANEQHQTALGIITQYTVIDLDQLRQDEIRIRENRDFVLNNTFSGAEDWLTMLNEELRFVMQKREDFYRYLSSVNGIYDGLFSGLNVDLSRMNLAEFSPRGGIFVKSFEKMYYLRQLAELDSDGNPIEFHWETIEEWLNGGDKTSLEQWAALSYILTLFRDDEDLTRFFELMLVQVDCIGDIVGAQGHMMEVPAWQLDMEIMAHLMQGLVQLSEQLSERQVVCGEPSDCPLSGMQSYILQLYTTLSNFVRMQYDEGFIFTGMPHIVGSPSCILPNFFSLSVARGENGLPIITFSSRGTTIAGILQGQWDGGKFPLQGFHIQALRFENHGTVDAANIVFNPVSTLQAIANASFLYGFGSLVPNPLDFFLSVLGAVEGNERERVNQQVVIDSAFGSEFQLYSFALLDQSGNVIETIQYPSYLTQDRLDRHNNCIERRNLQDNLREQGLPGPILTIDDVINRPAETYAFWDEYLPKIQGVVE